LDQGSSGCLRVQRFSSARPGRALAGFRAWNSPIMQMARTSHRVGGAQLGKQRLCEGPLWISDPQVVSGCSASLQCTQAAPSQVFMPDLGCMMLFPFH